MLRRPQPRFSLSMFSENLVVGVWKSLVLLASWDQRRLFQLWGNACPLSYLGSLCVLSGSPAQGRCGERALSPFTWHGILFPSRVDRWLVQLAGHECITHMCTVFLLLAGGEAQGHGSKSAKVETRLGFFFFFKYYSLQALSFILEELIYIFFSPLHFEDLFHLWQYRKEVEFGPRGLFLYRISVTSWPDWSPASY